MESAVKVVKESNEKTLSLGEQRQLVKAGMVSTLSGLFFTGFIRSKAARVLHPWLGVAFLGFSVWHYMISKSQRKK